MQESYFSSEDAYDRFCWNVKRGNQHILCDDTRAFVESIKATVKDRELNVLQGTETFRAQRGCQIEKDREISGIEERFKMAIPFPDSRMLPDPRFIQGGRANTIQRAVLYTSLDRDTAVAETRPWIGSWVSVARMNLQRDATMVDCAATELEWDYLRNQIKNGTHSNNAMVWWAIDRAFATPATLEDDKLEYLPTQILSELFRSLGYDGLTFKSSVSKGVNYVFFNPEIACIVDKHVVHIEQIRLKLNDMPF